MCFKRRFRTESKFHYNSNPALLRLRITTDAHSQLFDEQRPKHRLPDLVAGGQEVLEAHVIASEFRAEEREVR